jgi:FkbM family methyltransferase
VVTEEFMRSVKFVYESFCDEKSRNIFLNRLLWNITGERKFIENISIQKLVDHSFTEVDESVIVDILKKIDHCGARRLIIYGAGFLGKKIAKSLTENGVSVKCFCDKDRKKQSDGVAGLPVKEPLKEALTDEFVIVGAGKYSDEIYNSLISENIPTQKVIVPQWLIRHLDEENTYFEDEIVEFNDHEVFIDGGSFDFGSSNFLLKKARNKIKKIYAFEPEPEKWDRITAEIESSGFGNAELIKAGLWSKKDTLKFIAGKQGGSAIAPDGNVFVAVESLDGMNILEKVTFIKMDIEGAELEALRGARAIIRRNKPKLAICVYHKPNDIIDIPLYVKKLVPEYQFYLRHYSDYESETVMYAVIK